MTKQRLSPVIFYNQERQPHSILWGNRNMRLYAKAFPKDSPFAAWFSVFHGIIQES